MTLTRRQFTGAIAASLPLTALAAEDLWGGSVVDCHHHLRRTLEANVAHLDGCAVSNAMVLARESTAEQVKALREKYPGRFLGWFASADITKPDAADLLTKAVKNGAIGLGELKSHVEAAGPELRRM